MTRPQSTPEPAEDRQKALYIAQRLATSAVWLAVGAGALTIACGVAIVVALIGHWPADILRQLLLYKVLMTAAFVVAVLYASSRRRSAARLEKTAPTRSQDGPPANGALTPRR